MENNKKSSGMFASIAGVFLISMFCRVFGFLREVVIAGWFGTGPETDSYFMAIRIFNIFALLFGSILTTSYTPLYTHQLAKKKKKKSADKLTSNLLNIIIIISVLFTLFMVIGRIISGVHWITDIIGGVLLSTGLVMLYKAIIETKVKL